MIKILNANSPVTMLANIIVLCWVRIPNTNQRQTPKVKIEYIPREIDLVSFVFQINKACGINASVVHIAAR